MLRMTYILLSGKMSPSEAENTLIVLSLQVNNESLRGASQVQRAIMEGRLSRGFFSVYAMIDSCMVDNVG